MLLVMAWLLSFIGGDGEQRKDEDNNTDESIPNKKAGTSSEEKHSRASVGTSDQNDAAIHHQLVGNEDITLSEEHDIYGNKHQLPVYDQKNEHLPVGAYPLTVNQVHETAASPSRKEIVEDNISAAVESTTESEHALFDGHNYHHLSRSEVAPSGLIGFDEITEDNITAAVASMDESENPLFDVDDLSSAFIPSVFEGFRMQEESDLHMIQDPAINMENHLLPANIHSPYNEKKDLQHTFSPNQNVKSNFDGHMYSVVPKGDIEEQSTSVLSSSPEADMRLKDTSNRSDTNNVYADKQTDSINLEGQTDTGEISKIGNLQKGGVKKSTSPAFKPPSAKLTEFEKIMKSRKTHTDTMDAAAVIFGKLGHRDEKIHRGGRKLSKHWLHLRNAVMMKKYLAIKDIPLAGASSE